MALDDVALSQSAPAAQPPSRAGVPVTMFVLTDGVQTEDGGDSAAIAAASSAKSQGVQMFAVGFGSGPRFSTLEAMASPPSDSHALIFPSIEEARDYFGRNGLCAMSGPQPPPSPSPPPLAPSPPRAPKCAVEMELLLVLDRSGSVGRSMQTVLSFAQGLVSEFEVSQ